MFIRQRARFMHCMPVPLRRGGARMVLLDAGRGHALHVVLENDQAKPLFCGLKCEGFQQLDLVRCNWNVRGRAATPPVVWSTNRSSSKRG
jgi:hypothetical protein